MLETAILIFALVVLAAILAAILAIALLFKDELARKFLGRKLLQYRTMYRYEADANGNYPAYFDPRSGTYFAPGAGNRAIAEQFILNAGGAKQAIERQIVINPGRTPQPESIQPPDHGGMDIQEGEIREFKPAPELSSGIQLETSLAEIEPTSSVHVQRAKTDDEIKALLREYKANGRGKVDSLKDATQMKSPSGKKFLNYSAYWDSLPEFVPWKLNEEVVKEEVKEVE